MFAIFLQEVVAKVVHMTVEAFCSRGSAVASIAESAKPSPNRQAFEELFCTIVFD